VFPIFTGVCKVTETDTDSEFRPICFGIRNQKSIRNCLVLSMMLKILFYIALEKCFIFLVLSEKTQIAKLSLLKF